jgi:hypothetical protein
MFRKIVLTLTAAAALGALALSPTAASARGGHGGGGHGGGHGGFHGGFHGGGGWHGGGFHRGWGGPRFIGGPAYYGGGCVVRRVVHTPWGPRFRLVNRCY